MNVVKSFLLICLFALTLAILTKGTFDVVAATQAGQEPKEAFYDQLPMLLVGMILMYVFPYILAWTRKNKCSWGHKFDKVESRWRYDQWLEFRFCSRCGKQKPPQR